MRFQKEWKDDGRMALLTPRECCMTDGRNERGKRMTVLLQPAYREEEKELMAQMSDSWLLNHLHITNAMISIDRN